MTALPRVLFVCYGGGHVRMVLPVARRLVELGLARPVILGLTSARAEVLAAGFECLGFSDFIEPADAAAVEQGARLAAQLATQATDQTESAAYLGLNYDDLVIEHGEPRAQAIYARDGRQAFLPVRSMARILARVAPDLLVTTSAPRAERASVLAARQAGIPSVCLVDLFAATEIEWLRDPAYADRVCVLNERVRDRLQGAGRDLTQLRVTGNPAFDSLTDPAVRARGLALRAQRGWNNQCVLLWASQVEPLSHPAKPGLGNPQLPDEVAQCLRELLATDERLELVIRPHPSQAVGAEPTQPREWLSPRNENLHELLHACDVVLVMTSTVGIEARIAGCHVIQVLGSLYSADTPYLAYGIADQAVDLADLAGAVQRALSLASVSTHEAAGQAGQAADRVVTVLQELLPS